MTGAPNSPSVWIEAGDGLQVRLTGKTIEMHIPVGMTKVEAIMRIQPRIDAANRATGHDIQLVWADE